MEDNETKEASMSSIDDSSMENKEAMEASTTFNQEDLFKALEVVERDSLAIADSYTSLFASLRLALSEITNTSVDHIQCFSDAAGKLQESAIDAATRGNRFIHSCIRLNDEMKGIDDLAAHLKILKKNVDALDSAATRLLRIIIARPRLDFICRMISGGCDMILKPGSNSAPGEFCLARRPYSEESYGSPATPSKHSQIHQVMKYSRQLKNTSKSNIA